MEEYRTRMRRVLPLIALVLLFFAPAAQADNLTFAFIPHSTTDENFRMAKRGILEAAQLDGNEIREFGQGEAAHPRWQLAAIERALESKVDGIVLAPLDARVLAEALRDIPKDKRPPIVVIESDLPERFRHYRAAYVGTNAYDMGRMLGRLAKRFRPNGGDIALMGSWEGHASIQQRLWGIREELGGKQAAEKGRLDGENGWIEVRKSPWLCRDNYATALNQMENSLQDKVTDVFISAGWWPQMSQDYETVIAPFRSLIATGRKVVIIGDGVDRQQKLLDSGLATANVSQDFLTMGKTAYRRLMTAVDGGTPQEITYTPTKPVLPDD